MKINRDTTVVEVRKAFEQRFAKDIIKVTPDRTHDQKIDLEIPTDPRPVYKNW